MLQYDTLYQSLKKVSAEWHAGHVQWNYIWSYLKFYDDKTVIYCSSSQDREQLHWFNINNKDAYLYKGHYSIESNNKISFKIPVEIGTLEFEGNIFNESLILHSSNNKGHYSNWDEYKPE